MALFRLSQNLAGALALAAALVAGVGLAAAQDPTPAQILAPSGKLRAGLYPGTPTSILPAPAATTGDQRADGEPRGVGFELGRALAQKLGVPYEPIVFAKNAEVLEAVKTGAVDVAFTNATPVRAKEMDFGPPYLEIELGYLVPRGSAIATVADVDAPGRRVGVTAGSSSDAALSRNLENAQVVRATTLGRAAEMLSDGELDAFATNKATLFEMAAKLPDAKVLDGRWGLERHAIAIPKGRDAGLPVLKSFTEDAIASGLIAGAMARAGLHGATIPPAAK